MVSAAAVCVMVQLLAAASTMTATGGAALPASMAARSSERSSTLPARGSVAIGSAPNSWFLRKAAEIGGGTLTQIEPFYDHNYGKCVPELLYIGRSLRADLKEYEAQRKEEGQDER